MSSDAKSWATDQKTAALCCLALAFFALLPVLLTPSIAPDTHESVATAHQLPLTLQTLQLRLAEADAAQRMWLITGRERDRAAYTSTVDQIKELLTTLRTGTEIDHTQQLRFRQLEALVCKRLSEHSHLANTRSDGGLPAVATALSNEPAEQTTAQARALTNVMLADAQKLLNRTDVRLTTSRNGRIFSLVASLNLLILALGFRLVNRYIRQRKLVEQKLQEATDAAEGANQAKSAFLANMSHEIRTPLTAILGYTDMLVAEPPAQSQVGRSDCLSSIRRNARHLLDLLNDILDISKIEAGRMTAEKIAFDLPALAAEVASMMRPRAIEKGLEFRLSFDGPIPQKIKSDPVRLKQILVNLVGNAIKFTETGHVALSVSAMLRPVAHQDTATTEHAETMAIVRFDVSDTGIGLTPMQTERLFQPFTQADESMTRRFGGSGLGLTISRRLASLLGGAIAVQSTPLKGSTFTVYIDGGAIDDTQLVRGLTESVHPKAAAAPAAAVPARAAAAPLPEPVSVAAPASIAKNVATAPSVSALPTPFTSAPPAQERAEVAHPLANVRVLFAEDGKDNQRLICAHLKRAGAEVMLADNGKIALDHVLAQDFDIILMDMQMPELDGYGAARAIRKLNMSTPIIALTAHAMSEDRDKCLAAGCSHYLTKPVERGNLIRTISSFLSAKAVGGSAVSAVPAPDPALTSEYAADPDMLPLIHEFVAAFPEQVALMEGLVQSQQLDELRRQVHQLKGAGGGYGFQHITDLASRAEQTLGAAESLDAIVSQVRELTTLLSRIHAHTPVFPATVAGA